MYCFDQNVIICFRRQPPKVSVSSSDTWLVPSTDWQGGLCCFSPLLPVFWDQRLHHLQLLSTQGTCSQSGDVKSASTWASGEGLSSLLFMRRQRKRSWRGLKDLPLHLPFCPAASCVVRVEAAFLVTPNQAATSGSGERPHALRRGSHATKVAC